jgi:HAE1 family hydrophobic/amphiphilic exporter-1
MEINRDKALKAGVPERHLHHRRRFLGGAYVNDFNRFGRLYKAYIQAEPEYRLKRGQINLFRQKRDGRACPCPPSSPSKIVAGPDYTNRFNLYRSVELTGGPAPGYTSAQALDALEEVAAQVPAPPTWATPGATCPTRKSRPPAPGPSFSSFPWCSFS